MHDPIARSAARPARSFPHRPGWLLALAISGALPGLAQAANCAGVGQWDQARIYRAGDTLQKGGVLYQAKQDIWNAPPDHPAGAPYYTNLGACDGSGSNQPPVVSLTSPSNGATFSAGSTVNVSANASDTNGSISKVEFFRGGSSIGIDTSAPYSASWANASAGTHTLRAVATDNNNATASTATISITVNAASGDTTAPSVPGGLAVGTRTANSVALSWNASTDNNGGSGVAGYDVYRNGSLVG